MSTVTCLLGTGHCAGSVAHTISVHFNSLLMMH